jgi:hypothetical protein
MMKERMWGWRWWGWENGSETTTRSFADIMLLVRMKMMMNSLMLNCRLCVWVCRAMVNRANEMEKGCKYWGGSRWQLDNANFIVVCYFHTLGVIIFKSW